MTTQTHDNVAQPALKIITAWAAVGITSWAEAAAALAAAYTFLLITEWLWKKLIRPFCENRSWLKRAKRRRDDSE